MAVQQETDVKKSIIHTVLRHAVAAAGAFTLCASAAAADLKVGVNVAQSGPNSSLGLLYAKGMQAALAYQSEVAGRKIQLIIMDDGSDPTAAGRNARKLVNEDKVDVLMGASGVPNTIAMAQVARDAEVPFIALAPLAGDLAKTNSFVIAVPQPTDLMIDVVAEHMSKAGIKTVGYIGFSDAWGDLVYDGLMKGAKKYGLTVQSNERYARADASVMGQVMKMISTRPDAVMTGGSGTPGALPFLTLQERAFKKPVYGQAALINPDFVRVAGGAAQGALMSTGPIIVAEQLPDSYPTKKISLDFREVYKKTQNAETRDAYSAYSFDSWLIFVDAAKRAQGEPGTPEYRKALRDAIFQTKELAGTHGVYNFKPDNLYGVDERSRVMVVLDQGNWKLVQ
jgi:branched-chain amino acid transport system substrate-binding protein